MLIKKDILSTLAYFDIFDYPLTRHEIFLFLSNACGRQEFDAAINDLLVEGVVFKDTGFYSLHAGHLRANRRNNGNQKAQSLMVTANKVAALLSGFPFVRGIAVSGSLSKNYADETSDIDLFIITAKNRLWLARTFMHLFKKLTFIVNKQHCFCMNYYVDEKSLEIQEKNIYTAIEVVTLLPIKGTKIFMDFYAVNSWTKNLLPHHYRCISSSTEIESSILKNSIERILNNKAGNIIDSLLKKITMARWAKKTAAKKLNNKGMILSMHATKHFAKPDPNEFQQKLLKLYNQKVSDLVERYEVTSGQPTLQR